MARFGDSCQEYPPRAAPSPRSPISTVNSEVGVATLAGSRFGVSDHGPESFRRVGQSVDRAHMDAFKPVEITLPWDVPEGPKSDRPADLHG